MGIAQTWLKMSLIYYLCLFFIAGFTLLYKPVGEGRIEMGRATTAWFLEGVVQANMVLFSLAMHSASCNFFRCSSEKL